MKKENGISLATALKEINGLAQVGRDFLTKISLTNFDFDLYDESKLIVIHDSEIDKITTNKSEFKKRILFNTCEKKLPLNYYNIKVIFWEFESGMMEFRPKIFDRVNEVIAFTDFIYDYLKKVAPAGMKVTKMKYPYLRNGNISLAKEEARAKYKINPQDFVCFFNFDYRSSYDRKNPDAILNAFAQSIAKNSDAKLVVKTYGQEYYQQQAQKFNRLVQDLKIEDKVIITNDYMPQDELISLMNACDCYISLHRGEGLGKGMMDAMALGKPVIATDYSGNTEFTKEDNSLLVDYELVGANDIFDAYQCVQKWAEPNIETAKKHLEKLYSDRDFGVELGKKAQKFIDEYYSLDSFKQEVSKIFEMSERNIKADCLLQKKKKLFALQFVFDSIIKTLKKTKSFFKGILHGREKN